MNEYLQIPRVLYSLLKNQKLTKFEAASDLLRVINSPSKKVRLMNGIKVELKPNQEIIAYSQLAERWNWDSSAVRRLIKKLVDEGVMTAEKKGQSGKEFIVYTLL